MRLLRKLLCLWLLFSIAAGVYGQEPSPEPPAPQAEHHISEAEAKQLFRSLDDILQFASERTGLPIRHPVKKKLATREEVAKYVENRIKEQGGGERFDHSAVALKRLGLLPANFNLREYMLGLYKEQVEGWYDAHSKTVFLLDWVDPEAQKPVMAHELVHALQDQSYDLEHWLNVHKDTSAATGQMVLDEQRTARQAVIEGQAMIVLYDYQLTATGQTVETAPGIVEMMRSSMMDESDTPMYAQAPLFIREALLFPYTYGTDFVVSVLQKRGKQGAFAGVLDEPPVDTHQLMQPAAYFSHEPQIQLHVPELEKALGSGWKRDDFSGIGEIDLHVICQQWGDKEIAAKLSPAWRGGYYMTLLHKRSPKSGYPPLAVAINFSSADAANRFADLYGSSLIRRYNIVQPTRSAPKSPREWNTDDGMVRLYVEDTMVIALESFSPGDAAKLHDAIAASAKPFAIAAAP
jgi:hypothetical protein